MTGRKDKILRNWSITWRKWIYDLTLLMVVANIILILASWLLSAAMPTIPMRSLLSPGGIRWYLGTFTVRMANPELIYIIIIAIAWESLSKSNLYSTLFHSFTSQRQELSSQQLFALRTTCGVFLVEIITVLCLILMPHAVLLSITGDIIPSSFSRGFVPILSFMVTSCAILFSLLSGKMHSIYDVGQSMTSAGIWIMPLLLLYIVCNDFFRSFAYVFAI